LPLSGHRILRIVAAETGLPTTPEFIGGSFVWDVWSED